MTEPADIHFLDEDTLMPFPDLADASGLTIEHLVELAEFGVFQPVQLAGASAPSEWRVTSSALLVARRAARLRGAFELDTSGIAVALSLLERIDELQRELHELRCRFPGE